MVVLRTDIQNIIRLRIEKNTLQAIGDIYNVSRERIRQILKEKGVPKIKLERQFYENTPCKFCKTKTEAYSKKFFCNGVCREKYNLLPETIETRKQNRLTLARKNYIRNNVRYLKTRKKLRELPSQKIKTKARYIVGQAIKYGSLIRPDVCSVCKIKEVIQAHHKNYFEPLSVEWLCRKCHFVADLRDGFPRLKHIAILSKRGLLY